MAKGIKLDLSIGAHFDEEWQQVEAVKEPGSNKLLAPKAHRLVFKKEKRRGKMVTLVGVFSLEKGEAASYLKNWKKKLGCGGTYKEGWMEFQGDIVPKLRSLLSADGFSLK